MARKSAFINIQPPVTMNTNPLFLLLVGVSVAVAAAYLGAFMVLKRMSLVGDALSHVALPGMALALMFHLPPLFGAFGALILAVLLIWHIGERSAVYPEALVGVAFTGSLAIGMVITPEPELLEALFGNIQKISTVEGLVAIGLSLAVITITLLIAKKLMLTIISPDLARASGIKPEVVNLIYLLAIGVVVALGVKFVGTLLTGALVIVPAAAAKNISGRMTTYAILAVLIGATAAGMGVIGTNIVHIATGPLVVIMTIVFFVLTYLLKKQPAREEGVS